MEKSIYWNEILRFFIELYFELSLICLIRLRTYELDSLYEQVFTYSAAVVLGALVLLAYTIGLMLIHLRRFTRNPEIDRKYGTLWEDLDPSNRIGIMSVPFFMASRLIFVLVIVFYQDLVTFQLILITLVAFQQLLFTSFMPYESRVNNLVELMNLAATYIVTLLCFMLTDYIEDGEVRYMFGWVIIATVSMFIIVNIAIQLTEMARLLWDSGR